ncbi:hypothetical protein V1525DRAFT_420150 [Lipomyces kononenkoae]|uniref:Uncharacterized protein n=1 Tax=Lipomyces kononenkoae TaxID=34357 RepID=A0ACC3SZN7_LIPKO
MDQLEDHFGVSAFTIAAGPAKTKETDDFATPRARPFVEYDYNRRGTTYSFFADDANGPLAIEAGPSAATTNAVKVNPDTRQVLVFQSSLEENSAELNSGELLHGNRSDAQWLSVAAKSTGLPSMCSIKMTLTV